VDAKLSYQAAHCNTRARARCAATDGRRGAEIAEAHAKKHEFEKYRLLRLGALPALICQGWSGKTPDAPDGQPLPVSK